MITQFTALNFYAVKYDRIPKLKSVKYILSVKCAQAAVSTLNSMGGILEICLCCEQLSKIQRICLQAKHNLYLIIMPCTYYLLHQPSYILCLQNIRKQVSFL